MNYYCRRNFKNTQGNQAYTFSNKQIANNDVRNKIITVCDR